MSNPRLPPETLDYIVDLLGGNSRTLKKCCLVSKSWIPRARKHIFANIWFRSAKDLKSWEKTFPDPADSPAFHTHTLFVGCPQAVKDVDAGEGGWIRTFSRVERLTVNLPKRAVGVSLTPFQKLSPSLKSLRVNFHLLPCEQVFNLIQSFPLLEDLVLIGHNVSSVDGGGLDIPPTSPAFTGTLVLQLYEGIANIVPRLLNLPNGLRFRTLNSWWHNEESLRMVERLVVACSDTLECLEIVGEAPGLGPIDLSSAGRLKDVALRPGLNSEWVITTLQTISPWHQDLEEISIYIPREWSSPVRRGYATVLDITTEKPGTEWLDLDRYLVQFWELRSIRPMLVCPLTKHYTRESRDWCLYLFPELTRKRIILVTGFKYL